MSANQHPNCFRCRHFAITWDSRRAYLCRALGFRSPAVPWQVVVRTSGQPCQLYTPKPPRGSHQS